MIDDLLDEAAFAIGVMLMIFGLAAFRRTRKFIARCRTAEGRIAGYTSENSEEGLVYHYSLVRFRDSSGVEHEIRASRGQQEPPTVDTPVPITYDPTSPTNAWATGTTAPWLIPWIILIIGAAFVVGGFVVRAENS